MATTLVWITGASAGLGAALASTQPFPDAHVVDVSRSGGGPADEHLAADLADPAGWAAVAGHVTARLADADAERAVLIHNAGTVEPIGPAGAADLDAYARNVLLNSAAPQVVGAAFLRAARAFGGRADLVLISSGAATSAYEGLAAYGAGKAAAEQWVRTAGMEEARNGGARVLAVAPGVVDTPMQSSLHDAEAVDLPAGERFRALRRDGRLSAPEDAARAVWRVVTSDADGGDVVDVRDVAEAG